ncbi:MAG: thioredoxin family protein [Gammaproteobacteria bacterium]|nr:thioredoxin family protein [Gammaproteobacteria bacterium]
MRFLTNRLSLWLFGLCVVAGAASAADERAIFDQTLGDFTEELVEARDQGKQGILLFFEMDECPFCHRMKTTVLNQPEVIKYFKKHFLIFSIDIESDVEMTDFSGKTMLMKDFAEIHNRVRATPVFVFLDLNGKLTTRYTGPASGVEEFMWLGEYVLNEEYKKVRFTKYKRQRKKEKKKNKGQ